MSKVDEVLSFIEICFSSEGEFPSYRRISERCGVDRWQVANVLTYLVYRGDLNRTQIAEKGTRSTPKYRYQLGNLKKKEAPRYAILTETPPVAGRIGGSGDAGG